MVVLRRCAPQRLPHHHVVVAVDLGHVLLRSPLLLQLRLLPRAALCTCMRLCPRPRGRTRRTGLPGVLGASEVQARVIDAPAVVAVDEGPQAGGDDALVVAKAAPPLFAVGGEPTGDDALLSASRWCTCGLRPVRHQGVGAVLLDGRLQTAEEVVHHLRAPDDGCGVSKVVHQHLPDALLRRAPPLHRGAEADDELRRPLGQSLDDRQRSGLTTHRTAHSSVRDRRTRRHTTHSTTSHTASSSSSHQHRPLIRDGDGSAEEWYGPQGCGVRAGGAGGGVRVEEDGEWGVKVDGDLRKLLRNEAQ